MSRQLKPLVVILGMVLATCGGDDKKSSSSGGNNGGGSSNCTCTSDYSCQGEAPNQVCRCGNSGDYTLSLEEAKEQCKKCTPEGCTPSQSGDDDSIDTGRPDGNTDGSTDDGFDGATDFGTDGSTDDGFDGSTDSGSGAFE